MQDADIVGVLRTSGSPPEATNSSCAYAPRLVNSAYLERQGGGYYDAYLERLRRYMEPTPPPPQTPPPPLAAPPSPLRWTAPPPLGLPPLLLPPLLQIVLLPASILLFPLIAFCVFLCHIFRRSVNLRHSHDRAQFDLQLLAHQVRVQMETPCDDGQLSCAPSASGSAPPVKSSTHGLEDPPRLETSSSSSGATPDEEERETPITPADSAREGSASVRSAKAEHEGLETEMAEQEPRQQRESRKRRWQVAPSTSKGWLGFLRLE